MTYKYALCTVAAVLAAALAGCESPPRQAAPSRPADVQSAGSIDQRQREIEARLEDYRRSGRLSAENYRVLKSRADEIRRDERRSMADRDLTMDEQKRLRVQLDGLSRDMDRLATR